MTASTAHETAPTHRTGDTRHAGLDADDIIDAALLLVERDGGGALTMRKLAAELGVTPTTIYWHVGSRDDLVLALIRRLADRQAAATIAGDTAPERVISAATNIWRNALAHRNVTALASQVGASTLLELPLEVALVAELEAAGVRGAEARDALRAILACVAGFLIAAWRPADALPPELRPGALWADVVDGRVSRASIAAMAEPSDLDALFERTLRGVVETHVRSTPKTSRSTLRTSRSTPRTSRSTPGTSPRSRK